MKPPEVRVAELSSRDRDTVVIGDEIRDLLQHPAWKTYERVVLDSAIMQLTNEMLDGESLDPAFLQSIRYTLRAFRALRNHPYEYVELARSIRRDSGLTESAPVITEGEMNGS